jgi:hypothetical protein
MALFGASHFMNGDGIVIAFFLGTFGAAAASLSRWRTEPGLWMLAVLFLALFSAFFLTFFSDKYVMHGMARRAWIWSRQWNLQSAR